MSARNEKIEFILSNQKAFEMGEKYYHLDKMLGDLHLRVFNILWNMIDKKLMDHFTKSNIRPQKAFVISISDKKYMISCDDWYYGYGKFKFCGEYDDSIIKIL